MKQKKQNAGLVNSKKKLLEFQRLFASIIRNPLKKNQRMKPHKKTKSFIEASSILTPHERIELYAQQYWWRIQEAFDEDFRCLLMVLTKKQYETLRDSYLIAMPSRSFTLRNLGSRLYGFIKKHKKLGVRKKQLLLDCVAYDWARVDAFDAKDTRRIEAKEIMASQFSKKKIFLSPSAQILFLSFPIHLLVKNDTGTHTEVSSNTSLKKKKSSVTSVKVLPFKKTITVIFRREERVYFRVVGKEESILLSELKKGVSLENLVALIQKKGFKIDLLNLFQEWNALNLLTVTKTK